MTGMLVDMPKKRHPFRYRECAFGIGVMIFARGVIMLLVCYLKRR